MLFARGNPEVGLPKVDRLIKERNYNDAILELALYMNENPEDFDGAQRRIKRIIDMRDSYNKKAMELLLVLLNEPTNDAKKLEMISYLETLEKNPNAASQEFIAGTKAAAQFTYYRARFDEIMSQGNMLIDSSQWNAGARNYTEGFAFYKQEFDETSGLQLVSEVNRRLGSVISTIEAYTGLQDTFVFAIDQIRIATQSLNPEQIEKAFIAFEAVSTDFARYRNQIAEHGWFFEDTFTEIQLNNENLTENSFLPFAFRFILGRKTAGRFEGVLGVMDAQWTKNIQEIRSALETSQRAFWITSINSLKNGDTDKTLESIESFKRIARVGLDLSLPIALFNYREDTWGKLSSSLFVEGFASLSAIADELLAISDIQSRFYQIQTKSISLARDDASFLVVRNFPIQSTQSIIGIISSLDSLLLEIKNSRTRAAELGIASEYSREYEERSDALVVAVSETMLSLYRENTKVLADSSQLILDSWSSEYDKALTLLEGVPGSEGSPVLYYPQEALSVFSSARGGISIDRQNLQKIGDSFESYPNSVISDSQIKLTLEKFAVIRESLASLYDNTATGISRANSRILEATIAKQESERRYAQAQTSLNRNDFQTARLNLQRSREKANEYLSLQESAAFRIETDNKLAMLGSEITRIENEAVVREVRSLISSGKNFYFQGNFDQAEQVFIQAKTRWNVTNVEPNAEVVNWLEIINIALSMKMDRTFSVSDPLYPQMSQMLNNANQLFSEGKKLFESGNRSAGREKLELAKEKLQQVQLLAPRNQEAGQLRLKIDQLIDPNQFKIFFAEKVDYIRKNYRTEKQTSYNEILDLYLLNPNYPGLRNLVTEIEYYLGIRIPPPDPKMLARSAELTRMAELTYNRNIRSEFESALVQLDEAIKLNQDNTKAISLKDRVQTAIGGQTLAVLPAEEEAKYNKALQLLFSGAKYDALALVNELLQNPKSKNSSKVQDLKNRIESQL